MTKRTGLNSERIGRDNLSTVLREVHQQGAVSRSELAERTGLYRQTIRSLVGQLAARGLVTEEPMAPEGSPGRPSFVVQPSADVARVIAIDIEVDSVAVALVGLGGAMLKSMRISRPRDMVAVNGTIAEVVVACRGLLDGEDTSCVRGIGVAVVGLVRRSDGVVRMAPNLGWRDVPLAQLLDEKLALGVPVHVGNEADLGAIAEHVRGAAAGIPDFLYVSGEAGIGGGVIAAGRPVTGWGGYAGEIGHMVVNPTGEQCGCGSVGCWETEVGEGALIRRAGGPSDGLRDRVVDEIIRAATDGDPRALDAVREVGRWTGIGLGILVNIFNPRAIVLGGLFARLHPLIEDTVNEELRGRATVALREDLDVRAGRFGMDAPLMGAAELAFEDLLARPDDLPLITSAKHRSVSRQARAT